MTPAILSAILSLPRAWYPDGTAPETGTEEHARFAVIAQAVEDASARAVCREKPTFVRDACVRLWPGREDELQAMLVTLAWWESKFVWRVHAGRCRPEECDPIRLSDGSVFHRAKGPWQTQKTNLVPLEEWRAMTGTDVASTAVAAFVAVRNVAAQRARCAPRGGAWVEATIAGYATGQWCGWSHAAERARTYREVLDTIRAGDDQNGSEP